MTLKKLIGYIVLCTVMALLVGFSVYFSIKNNPYDLTKTDTVDFNYNKSEIDSIYTNIVETDSLINNIKRLDSIRYEEIWNLNDSNSIELFYKLSKGR